MSLATLFQEVENAFRPTGVSLRETDEAFVIEALMAGVKAKDIHISYEKGNVTIEGKSERYGYSYLVPLPSNQMDESAQIEAVTEEGILRLSFPKAKMAKPLKITVKASS